MFFLFSSSLSCDGMICMPEPFLQLLDDSKVSSFCCGLPAAGFV